MGNAWPCTSIRGHDYGGVESCFCQGSKLKRNSGVCFTSRCSRLRGDGWMLIPWQLEGGRYTGHEWVQHRDDRAHHHPLTEHGQNQRHGGRTHHHQLQRCLRQPAPPRSPQWAPHSPPSLPRGWLRRSPRPEPTHSQRMQCHFIKSFQQLTQPLSVVDFEPAPPHPLPPLQLLWCTSTSSSTPNFVAGHIL